MHQRAVESFLDLFDAFNEFFPFGPKPDVDFVSVLDQSCIYLKASLQSFVTTATMENGGLTVVPKNGQYTL